MSERQPVSGEIQSEADLAAVCARLVKGRPRADLPLAAIRRAIEAGEDPLGDAFCRMRSPAARRPSGAVYTPPAIVGSMMSWASRQGEPVRVVDPGCGSGRFILAAARTFRHATLVATDTDPLAILMLRANAAVLGFGGRLRSGCTDYRAMPLPPVNGPTLFIGNPPYVRHHQIDSKWKEWFGRVASEFGLGASKLAGLHVHFFLRTRQLARVGDFGAFITASEWLDVNYGATVRGMLADGLGGSALHVLVPEAKPFSEAAATGAISCFRVGQRPQKIVVRSVASSAELGDLSKGRSLEWNALAGAPRWSGLIRGDGRQSSGGMELGELFRVHRGQVTGCNRVWVAGNHSGELPARFLVRAVTGADELFSAGAALDDPKKLKNVIDLPAELDSLSPLERDQVGRFLAWAREHGAASGFVASHRRAWWAVGLRAPAPILCTYMARRPPAFVRNVCRARHINIAHGLYPRQPLPEETLSKIVDFLRKNVGVESGRTYAGGLTKFEPREIERLRIPRFDCADAIS